jgi:hypothetical protein
LLRHIWGVIVGFDIKHPPKWIELTRRFNYQTFVGAANPPVSYPASPPLL